MGLFRLLSIPFSPRLCIQFPLSIPLSFTDHGMAVLIFLPALFEG
jgi:hypothetical protein